MRTRKRYFVSDASCAVLTGSSFARFSFQVWPPQRCPCGNVAHLFASTKFWCGHTDLGFSPAHVMKPSFFSAGKPSSQRHKGVSGSCHFRFGMLVPYHPHSGGAVLPPESAW